jgi:serine/threonine protein kinase
VSAAGTPAPVTPVRSASAPAQTKTSYIPQTEDPLINSKIADRYLIQRKLGEGGMGAVYLATHMVLEKQVALKVLHGEFARKPDLVERFMQEAKAASRIRHENVIDISDFGATPEGIVFFAMELLKGHDLHEEVARARLSGHLLPWSRTKKIFLQICSALAEAHAKGIVHRDLKPENVYLVDFLGEHDFVKLLDFGIAKLTEVNEEGGRKLTKTGMLFGTPEYMSPEQARGEHVDHRVDIYAMGCILFQLITNHVPFEAENFMGVLSLHLTEAPPTIAPETFDMIGAPRALTQVIERALIKDRDQRYQTMDELANAVRMVCGDPLPADRVQPVRAASVQASASVTRARSPSAVVQPVLREPTGRVKTEWTGNLKVPEELASEPAPPKKKSKLPLAIGAVVLIGGGIAAAVVASSGGESAGQGSQVASGSPAVVIPPQPPVPPPQTVVPPPVAVEPPLPDMAKISLDSTPHGATVTDLTTNKAIGKTPLHYSLAGSKTPRQFVFHLRGFSDTTVELVPNRATIEYSETLQKGAAGSVVVHKVTDPVLKAVPLAGSAAVPDLGGAVTKPEAGSAEVNPETKPPEVKPPPKDDCPEIDDGLPCLKTKEKVPGLAGSGSGS